MSRYASTTAVSCESTRFEIERTLRRYRADSFGYITNAAGATVAFKMAGRSIRFNLPLPDPTDKEFTHSSRGPRSPDVAERAWEQACRQRWRALALVIKAKLEAVAAGITTVEDEFLAHTVLPNGQPASEWLQPQIVHAIESGGMPNQLQIAGPQ